MRQAARFLNASITSAALNGTADYRKLRPNETRIITAAKWEMLFGKKLHQRGEHSLNTIAANDDPPARLSLYDAAYPPTFETDRLLTYAGNENALSGLLTPELELDEECWYIVVKIANGTPNQAVIGTLQNAGVDTPDKGWMIWRPTGAAVYDGRTRGITTAAGTVLVTTLPSGLTAGQYAFFAVSHTLTGTAHRDVFIGGASVAGGAANYTSTVNGSKVKSDRLVAIGNRYLSAYGDTLEVVYLAPFTGPRTPVEMAADYLVVRAALLALRGITVF